MIKKIGRIAKFLILAYVWTVLFLGLSRLMLKLIWKFDILSIKQWRVIAEHWNSGGSIRGVSDFSLFITLVIIVVFWLVGIRKVNKINYLKLFMKPIEYLNNRSMRKYENLDTHVVIKNISVGEKLSVEDLIKDRINQEKVNVAKDAEALRKNISEKIIQRKEQ